MCYFINTYIYMLRYVHVCCEAGSYVYSIIMEELAIRREEHRSEINSNGY